MGRIQDALHCAERSRTDKREKATTLVRIKHLAGSLTGREQRFHLESILIGRGSHNDVTFDPFEDSTVSAQHAEIRREADGYTLYDMGSLNGTHVNGFPVRRAILNDGDEIALGRNGPTFEFQAQLTTTEAAVGPSPSYEIPPPSPRLMVKSDCPPTAEVAVFEEEDVNSKISIILMIILAGILVDVTLNVVRLVG